MPKNTTKTRLPDISSSRISDTFSQQALYLIFVGISICQLFRECNSHTKVGSLSPLFWDDKASFRETNIAPENRPSQEETIVFQLSICRGYVCFREGTQFIRPPPHNLIYNDGPGYKPVANLSSWTPGDKPKTLIQKYDTSGDGEIGPKERRLQMSGS